MIKTWYYIMADISTIPDYRQGELFPVISEAKSKISTFNESLMEVINSWEILPCPNCETKLSCSYCSSCGFNAEDSLWWYVIELKKKWNSEVLSLVKGVKIYDLQSIAIWRIELEGVSYTFYVSFNKENRKNPILSLKLYKGNKQVIIWQLESKLYQNLHTNINIKMLEELFWKHEDWKLAQS